MTWLPWCIRASTNQLTDDELLFHWERLPQNEQKVVLGPCAKLPFCPAKPEALCHPNMQCHGVCVGLSLLISLSCASRCAAMTDADRVAIGSIYRRITCSSKLPIDDGHPISNPLLDSYKFLQRRGPPCLLGVYILACKVYQSAVDIQHLLLLLEECHSPGLPIVTSA